MARGLVSGVITGLGVSAAFIFVAALALDPVKLGEMPVPVAEPDVAAVSEPAPEPTPSEDSLQAAETPPEMAEADAPSEPVAEAPEPVAEEPAQEPAAPIEMAEPETTEAAPEPEPAPVDTAEPEPAREAPENETETVVVTPDPDAPSAPDTTRLNVPEPEVADEAPETAPVAPKVNRLPQVEAPDAPAEDESDLLTAEAGDAIEAAPSGADMLSEAEEGSGVVSNRLPRIGADDNGAAPEATMTPRADMPAIDRNGVPFEGDELLPRMSVLLLDTGAARSEVGDLGMLPFPLSVAIYASASDAQAAMEYYRESGAEVVLIVPLPAGATASDVDVTFQVYEPLLEQAVAVMIPEAAGFQSLGPAAEQVATVLHEHGLGLVSWPEGLNTGHKSAVKEGVPAAMVFRDLDGEGQTPDVIRRFLDNVAFRARNEEGTLAVARVTPDSLQAVLEWSLGNRAQSVNLAPVSAVLPR